VTTDVSPGISVTTEAEENASPIRSKLRSRSQSLRVRDAKMAQKRAWEEANKQLGSSSSELVKASSELSLAHRHGFARASTENLLYV